MFVQLLHNLFFLLLCCNRVISLSLHSFTRCLKRTFFNHLICGFDLQEQQPVCSHIWSKWHFLVLFCLEVAYLIKCFLWSDFIAQGLSSRTLVCSQVSVSLFLRFVIHNNLTLGLETDVYVPLKLIHWSLEKVGWSPNTWNGRYSPKEFVYLG